MALIESYLEAVHANGYTQRPQGAETVTAVGPAIWDDLPWGE
jgi:peptidyl-tRNA hydrolase